MADIAQRCDDMYHSYTDYILKFIQEHGSAPSCVPGIEEEYAQLVRDGLELGWDRNVFEDLKDEMEFALLYSQGVNEGIFDEDNDPTPPVDEFEQRLSECLTQFLDELEEQWNKQNEEERNPEVERVQEARDEGMKGEECSDDGGLEDMGIELDEDNQ